MEVEPELADQLPVSLDAEEADVRMPDVRLVRRNRHREHPADQAEQPVEDARQLEVLLDRLVGERVARLFQLLAGPGEVPRTQFADAELGRRELAQLRQIALGERACAPRQVAQEGDDFVGRVGHLRHQRHLGEAGIAEQDGFFAAQREQLVDDRRIVEPGLLFSIFRRGRVGRRASDVGAVHRLAQHAVIGVLHHRQVRRKVQRELPAIAAVGLRGLARRLARIGRQAVEAGLVVDEQPERIGRVEHVLGELLRERRVPILDFGETLARRRDQFGATEAEVAQRVLDGPAARRAQRGEFGLGCEGLVAGEQRLVLRQLGKELRDPGQVRVVDLAQRRRVGHRVQVADDAPGASEPFGGVVERLDEGVPGERHRIGGHILERFAGLRDQHVEGRADELRLEGGEARQAGEVEQRIAGARGAVGGRVGRAVGGLVGHGSGRWAVRVSPRGFAAGVGSKDTLRALRRQARPCGGSVIARSGGRRERFPDRGLRPPPSAGASLANLENRYPPRRGCAPASGSHRFSFGCARLAQCPESAPASPRTWRSRWPGARFIAPQSAPLQARGAECACPGFVQAAG